MSTESHPWGRVADDGTVYVRTAEGERVVGIWQAGSPDEALAFFTRRYDSLATEVSLLEKRIATTDLAPGQAKATIARLHAAIAEAKAVGDLDGLARRLDALTERADAAPAGAQGGPGPGQGRGDRGQGADRRRGREDRRRGDALEVQRRPAQGTARRVEGSAARRPSGRGGAVEADVGRAQRLRQAPQGLLRRPRGGARGGAGTQAGTRHPGRGALLVDRLGRDRGRLPRADGVVEGGRPRRPGGRRRAVEAVQGRPEHLLRCPVGRDVGQGQPAARAGHGQGGAARRGRAAAPGDRPQGRQVRAALDPPALGQDRCRSPGTRRSGSKAA